MAQALTPGKTAVLAEVQETWTTPVNTKLQKLGGIVLRHQRCEIIEDLLVRKSAAFDGELKQLKKELAQVSAEDEAALQREIEDVKKELTTLQSQAEARQEHVISEASTKIDIMRQQMKQTNERQKAKTKERIAEVKADYIACNAKLEQAIRLIKIALSP